MPWAIPPNAASGPICGTMNPIFTGAPSASGCVVSAGQLSVGTLNVAPAAPVDGTDEAADVSAVVAAVVAGGVASPGGGAGGGTRAGGAAPPPPRPRGFWLSHPPAARKGKTTAAPPR